jgi:organic radical activating enzyme
MIQAFARRADYVRRHAWTVWPYLTARKLANLALNQMEMQVARTRPRSFPPFLKVEATPLCHLSCGGCVHGSKSYKKTLNNKMHLTVDRLNQIIEPIIPTLIGVSLSYSGEPLLNRQIPGLVRYLHEARISTSFSTNLSIPMSEAQAEALVGAGLDRMQISLDGATEDTYRRYRIGGNFTLVLQNVRKLAEAKLRLGATRPNLVWKMVIFPYNAHEIPTVKRTARSLGFDSFEFVLDNDGDEKLQVLNRENSQMVAAKKPCFWVWNTATIGWDGGVQACCKQINQIWLGNALQEDIRTIWRGDHYAAIRSRFSRSRYGDDMHPVCRNCVGLPPR